MRSDPEYRADTIHIGPFIAKPRVSVISGQDSNVFNTADSSAAEMFTAMPSIMLHSDLSQHELNIAASGTVRRFSRYRTENSDEFVIGAEGRISIAGRNSIIPSFSYAQLVEPRSSAASNRNAAEPVSYSLTRIGLLGKLEFGRLNFYSSLNYQSASYYDLPLRSGYILNQNFRDTRSIKGEMRFEYNLLGSTSVFSSASYSIISNPHASEVIGRDGANAIVWVGVISDITPLIYAEIAIGHLSRKFNYNNYRNLYGPTFQIDLQWYPTPLFSFQIKSDRSLRNSGNPQSGNIISDRLTGSIFYDPLRNIKLSVTTMLERDRYREMSTRTQRRSIKCQAEWSLNRRLSFGAYITILRQVVSNSAAVTEFSAMRAGIGFTLTP